MTDPEARERQVIRFLEDWPWGRNGSTVIGGYAVAAYGGARYSDDIDFVVPIEERSRITQWLVSHQFERRKGREVATQTPFEQAIRFHRDPVTVDVMVGFVRDREAKVDIPEHWIAARARRVKLDLLAGRVDVLVRVARPEALWALKLQSGRVQDLADLFSIMDEPADLREVRTIFSGLMVPTLGAKLATVLARLDDPKVYTDARSLRALKDTQTTRDRWGAFRERVAGIIKFGE